MLILDVNLRHFLHHILPLYVYGNSFSTSVIYETKKSASFKIPATTIISTKQKKDLWKKAYILYWLPTTLKQANLQ